MFEGHAVSWYSLEPYSVQWEPWKLTDFHLPLDEIASLPLSMQTQDQEAFPQFVVDGEEIQDPLDLCHHIVGIHGTGGLHVPCEPQWPGLLMVLYPPGEVRGEKGRRGEREEGKKERERGGEGSRGKRGNLLNIPTIIIRRYKYSPCFILSHSTTGSTCPCICTLIQRHEHASGCHWMPRGANDNISTRSACPYIHTWYTMLCYQVCAVILPSLQVRIDWHSHAHTHTHTHTHTH